jgi:hypothetical protein
MTTGAVMQGSEDVRGAEPTKLNISFAEGAGFLMPTSPGADHSEGHLHGQPAYAHIDMCCSPWSLASAQHRPRSAPRPSHKFSTIVIIDILDLCQF